MQATYSLDSGNISVMYSPTISIHSKCTLVKKQPGSAECFWKKTEPHHGKLFTHIKSDLSSYKSIFYDFVAHIKITIGTNTFRLSSQRFFRRNIQKLLSGDLFKAPIIFKLQQYKLKSILTNDKHWKLLPAQIPLFNNANSAIEPHLITIHHATRDRYVLEKAVEIKSRYVPPVRLDMKEMDLI